MAQQHTGGYAASAGVIDINPDEITHIYKELVAILNEFETVIVPELEKIKANKYLTKGKAEKAMEKVPDANERILEIQDQVGQASSLVVDILNTMIETDQKLAEQIANSLNIGGEGS